ncbi:MAG: neutral/alkaline non-lysosomal ceramidase N-terminal domain-containing protein [Flammeovirgaceae bacterium]|nr:neutral/alkaline non-lysosomal ceramidase N-terminal domain-containing protein [Flammeovirgaceae bacterium]
MKKLIKWLVYAGLGLFVLAMLLVGPIDKTPLKEQPFYQTMVSRLDTIHPNLSRKDKVKVGWAKFNITPSYSLPMAGYTPKDKYESIHDSIYGGVIAMTNGSSVNVFVSLDLMLFPPSIKNRVNEALKRQGKDYFVYYSATHTHSSLGGWDASLVGRLVLGSYHAEWVDQTANDILDNIDKATTSSISSTIQYWENDASEFVENRLDAANGQVDGKLRGLKFNRADSSKAVIVTYSAHPTNVELLSRVVSGDYPSALTKQLEKRGFDFGLFMAGMVGSHRLKGIEGTDFERIDKAGLLLAEKVVKATNQNLAESISISSAHIPIAFGSSQLRIAKDWKVRDWVFRSLLNPLQGELTYLQVGHVVFIGTPADFSGEIFAQEKLEAIAAAMGKKLILTSFNGNYTGYVTADHHYAKGSEEEVMALNWVGPYFGDYYTQMLKQILNFEF